MNDMLEALGQNLIASLSSFFNPPLCFCSIFLLHGYHHLYQLREARVHFHIMKAESIAGPKTLI